jgi:hypothetical protein
MIFCRPHGWHLIIFRLEHLLTPDNTEEHFISFQNIYIIFPGIFATKFWMFRKSFTAVVDRNEKKKNAMDFMEKNLHQPLGALGGAMRGGNEIRGIRGVFLHYVTSAFNSPQFAGAIDYV